MRGLINCEVFFDVDNKEKGIAELEKKMSASDFWNSQEKAQQVIDKMTVLKKWVEPWKDLNDRVNELYELAQLAQEEDDSSLTRELEENTNAAISDLEKLEFLNMLSGEDDHRNAILTIHPGAGGTESQDWAEMLSRMYLRWIEEHGYEHSVLDCQPGDEAGIKSVTIEVKGDYAYGRLRAENGVHRLVRISPFDANSKRHTSFASVFVYPEIDSDVKVEIDEKDLKIDTFRASGAGGQHVNKTESAVRITHIPTGMVAQSQSERSQHRNRENAMKILMSRIYQKLREENEEKREKLEGQKKEIAWGSQIRSYVFHPYNMVKDHRTKAETSNIQAVMNGDIDMFIESYLSQFSKHGG